MLVESERRFRDLTESTSDWVWEVDRNAVYTCASPRINDLLGYEPEEVLGKTPFDFLPPEEAKRVAAVFWPPSWRAPSACVVQDEKEGGTMPPSSDR
jgi:PAS domain S-box-containing protein